ncbi:MAG: hypothetical protein LBU45_08515 [Azoarcus sp.]|nr:hypothetical protein [Azoarcus sp.]
MTAAHTRLLSVIEAISGHEVRGLRLVEVARAVGCIESTALRDLESLEGAGWAQRLPDGRWCLAPRPLQILFNFQAGLSRASERVAEVRQNYTRVPV